MYDNNDIKKKQAEVLKEGVELQNDINESVKEINRDIFDINNAGKFSEFGQCETEIY